MTRWHLDEPAASYLVTVAIGDFEETRTARERRAADLLDATGPAAFRVGWRSPPTSWTGSRRGSGCPFSSLGFVLVDRARHGDADDDHAGLRQLRDLPGVIVHEMVHQWYGNQVTPSTGGDVWMNEGMAMYLQLAWQADYADASLETVLGRLAPAEPLLRLGPGRRRTTTRRRSARATSTSSRR